MLQANNWLVISLIVFFSATKLLENIYCTSMVALAGGPRDTPHDEPLLLSVAPVPPFCPQLAPAVRSPYNTITAMVSNRGAALLLENMICSMRRAGMDDLFVVFATDAVTCPYLEHQQVTASSSSSTSAGALCIDYWRYDGWHNFTESEGSATAWGSAGHSAIIKRKMHAAYDVLACGHNVLWLDTDLVFVRDPLPYLWAQFQDNKHLEMLWSDDNNEQQFMTRINSGFFMLRNTPSVRSFLNASIVLAETMDYIDQIALDMVLEWGNITERATWQLLPMELFPTGSIMHAAVRDSQEAGAPRQGRLSQFVFVLHANWTGTLLEKLHMLSQLGWWLIDLTTRHCWSSHDPPPAKLDFPAEWQCSPDFKSCKNIM